MTIEIDGAGSRLPPLKPKKDPLVTVAEILAVDDVHMVAGRAPLRQINNFYVDILGFKADVPRNADYAFRFLKLRVEFMHTEEQALQASSGDLNRVGKLMLLIKQFSTAMRALEEARVPFELATYDLGMCRALYLFDPAGNQVILLETRPM